MTLVPSRLSTDRWPTKRRSNIDPDIRPINTTESLKNAGRNLKMRYLPAFALSCSKVC